jgi:Flp pilus assembly pilin Flp
MQETASQGGPVVLQAFAIWCRVRARAVQDDEQGASLIEYALLVALIAIVCIVAIQFLGSATSSQYSQVGSALKP